MPNRQTDGQTMVILKDFLGPSVGRGSNNAYSSYLEIIFNVPQGSIIGPFLFIIHICDMFFGE